ncbi:MAG: DHA1 family inner membrane transport protein [Granulosicoccus sp.]
MLLLGLFAGSLAANIGLRKLLLAGLVLGSAVSLFQSTGLSISLLLASRTVEGVAHLAIVVSAQTFVALSSSDRMRAAAMTLWGSFFGVSYMH